MSVNSFESDISGAMSAESLKGKRSCCKSGCLHCPYGFTVKKFGIQFSDLTDLELANKLTNNKIDLETYTLENYKFVLLKNYVCGVIRIDHLFVRQLFIRPEFSLQSISKELVESYYFY